MSSDKNINILGYFKKRSVQQFLFFVAVAFVFLIFSKLSNDYKQTITLKVKLKNIEDEIVLENDSTKTINAYIEAKGFALIPYMFKSSTTIILDAKTDVLSQDNKFIFDVKKHQFLIEGQLGKSYDILSLSPDELVLPYSTRASKMVPVTLTTDIDYAVGYDLKDDFKLSIDSIKVVGPASEVEKIKTLNTEKLTLSTVNKDISEEVKINSEAYGNIDVFPKSIKVEGAVTRFTEGTIQIPITITNKPKDVEINYFPKEVTIVYYVDLEQFKFIKAADFIVECDYSEIVGEQTYFVPKVINKPEYVKRISIKQKRIDFIKL